MLSKKSKPVTGYDCNLLDIVKKNDGVLLRARQFFLTYPMKSNNGSVIKSKQILHNQIIKKFVKRKSKILTLITSHETSDNDHPYEHYHVYLRLDRKTNIKVLFFDVLNTHGEYQLVKMTRQCIEYTQKDEDYLLLDNDLFSYQMTNKAISVSSIIKYLQEDLLKLKKDKRYKSLRSSGITQLINYSIKKLDRDVINQFLLNKERINKAVYEYMMLNHRSLFEINKPTVYPANSYNVPKEVIFWEENLAKTQVLVLKGVAGAGKTGMILSRNPDIFMVDNLNKLSLIIQDELKRRGILLDDPKINHLIPEELISLFDVEQERCISNMKYTSTTIPAQTPRIFITNDLKRAIPKAFKNGKLLPEIKRRLYIYEVEYSLIAKGRLQTDV